MVEADPGLDLLATIESGTADRRILEFAALGFVPLPPEEMVRALAFILSSQDADLAKTAEQTFRGLEVDAIAAAVRTEGILPQQLDAIAHRTTEPRVLEPLLRARTVSDETLAWLAERVGADLQDILVTNQVRLLAAPVIVERLFENPHLSPDIRRRADEFLEEFFFKKMREEAATSFEDGIEALGASDEVDEAAAAAAGAVGAAGPGSGPEGGHGGAGGAEAWQDEVPEDDKTRSFFSRMSGLSVVQRIRLAYKGNREERLFLVRDRNRLVCSAVLKSPKTSESDIEAIANLKSVSEDVLRLIATGKQWTRKYSIVLALVKNPRSPVDISMALVNRLQAKDQKTLASDRGVSDAVRSFARRVIARREK